MVEKRVKKFGQGSPPPPFRAMPKRKHFFFQEGFPKLMAFAFTQSGVSYINQHFFILTFHHQRSLLIKRKFHTRHNMGENYIPINVKKIKKSMK